VQKKQLSFQSLLAVTVQAFLSQVLCHANDAITSLTPFTVAKTLKTFYFVEHTSVKHCCCRCIDGFSRKILWLKAASSNHNPAVIVSYFLSAVQQYGGYPNTVRTDCGTENTLVAAIQTSVTHRLSSHVYGSSPGNQRIECWWSFFRRNRSSWWLELFEDLIHLRAYDPSIPEQVNCLRFCFMRCVQSDLDEVRRDWNIHRIRPSRDARCPAGIPDELFYLPPPTAFDCIIWNGAALPTELLNQLEEPRTCDNNDLLDYFMYLCNNRGWPSQPTDVNSATELYLNLVQFI